LALYQDIAGFVSQMPLLYIASHLSPKIWRHSLKSDWWAV